METAVDYDKALEIAIKAANGAGEIIARSIKKNEAGEVEIFIKHGVDMVTETDKASECHILKTIKDVFPTHKFIAEESWKKDDLTDEPTWLIDPLDGTTNYVHSYPFVAVCIALVVKKEPVVGVVWDVFSNQLYSASKGKGAFLDGKRISVSTATELCNSMLITNIGASRDESFIQMIQQQLGALMRSNVRAIRMMGACGGQPALTFCCPGSAALCMMMVATGRGDLFYEFGFGGPWDVAAGAVILAEAGGVVLDPDGGVFDMMSRRVLCGATREGCEELIQILTGATKATS